MSFKVMSDYTHKCEIDSVSVHAGQVILQGTLAIPKDARGLVLFVHGSGSSRMSPRNRFVAQILNENRIATFLFDLLTEQEEDIDSQTAHLRFDIELLSRRLIDTTDWILKNSKTSKLNVGYFGASTGAAAALVGAAKRSSVVKAVVSRGGRPDLAGNALAHVKCPTLLIVGGDDDVVIELNKEAMTQMKSEKKLAIVPGATHLFEEPGKLEEVSSLACDWFIKYLGGSLST